LEFSNEVEVQKFIQGDKSDKGWIFGGTWKGRIEKNRIIIQYYPPLSEQEFQQFLKSRESVPNKICRFDQFYAKQIAIPENKFNSDQFKIINP